MVPYLIKMMGKKVNTISYPFEQAQVPDQLRGMLKFDCERCNGCKLCMRFCPADAIEIKTVGEKKYQAFLALDKCIFCGQCVDSCHKDALESTTDFELANDQKASLEVPI